MTSAIQAVLFDYGGVLTGPMRNSIGAWLAADDIDPASLTATLKAWMSRDVPDGSPIHRLETGELSVDEFGALFAAQLVTRTGVPVVADGVLARMFANMELDEDMFRLAAELRDQGLKVGLLSNSWGNSYPRARIDSLFDPVVISGEVGLRKPHSEIYELAARRLDLAPETIVFIDDAQPNLVGARASGLKTILHTTATETRAQLAEVVGAR